MSIPLAISRIRGETTSSEQRQGLPPGPPNGLLGLHHVEQLKHDLVGFMQRLVRDYGDCVTYRIGPVRFFVFAHPDQISELLVKQAPSLRKLSMVRWYFKRWMGNGLLLNEGEPWRVQRRKVRWAMQQLDPVVRASQVIQTCDECLGPCWDRTVDMARLMDRLAFSLNVRSLFGGDAEGVLGPLYESSDALHHIGIEELTHWEMLPDWAPTRSKARLRSTMRTYDRLIMEQVLRREGKDSRGGDLLSWMLVAIDRKGGTQGMTARQARDEVANLLMGGKETVGATLTFSLWLLAGHPEIQDQAAAEVQLVLGNRPPNTEDMQQLHLVRRIIQEAMRLYPPVYTLAREVAQTIWIGGYRIPRGSQVQVPVYAVHRDPRWYAEPEQFRPDRFLPEVSSQRPMYTHIPFGVGPRSCVGKEIGHEQCVLVLAEFLRRARFSLPPGAQPPALTADIVLHPRDPLPVIVERRIAGSSR